MEWDIVFGENPVSVSVGIGAVISRNAAGSNLRTDNDDLHTYSTDTDVDPNSPARLVKDRFINIPDHARPSERNKRNAAGNNLRIDGDNLHATSKDTDFARFSPNSLSRLVGDRDTEITDDVIQISVNLMKAYTDESLGPYIAYYTPAALHLFTALNQDHTSTNQSQQIPLDRSSINIHPLFRHWVTSYYNMNSGSLCIYDSLKSAAHLVEVKRQLQIMYGHAISSKAEYVNVTQQALEPICGVMAVAFAFSCLIGKDPSSIHFDIGRARQHLRNCILEGQMRPFPTNEHSDTLHSQTNNFTKQSERFSLLDKYFEDQKNRNNTRVYQAEQKRKREKIRKELYRDKRSVEQNSAEKQKDKLRKIMKRVKMSDEQKKVEKIKQQTRMNIYRKSVGIEKNDVERRKDKYRKTVQRNNMSEQQNKAEKVKQKRRMDIHRKSLSIEKKDVERRKDKSRKRVERNNMSAQQKQVEKVKNKSRMNIHRKSLSIEKKDVERQNDKYRKTLERNNMSAQQKQVEKVKEKTRINIHRKSLSIEKKAAEKQEDKYRKALERNNMSDQQNKAEKVKQKTRMNIHRKSRSLQKKNAERQKDKCRKTLERNNMSEQQNTAEKVKQKTRMDIHRKRLSIEKKDVERRKDKYRKTVERNNMSAHQKQVEKVKKKSRMNIHRKSLSIEKKDAEKQKDKYRKALERNNMNDQQNKAEKVKQKTRMNIHRKSLSLETKDAERQKDKSRKTLERNKMSGKQKTAQKLKNKLRMIAERTNMTSEKILVSRQRNKQLKHHKRTNCVNNEVAIKEFKAICLQGPVHICCSCMRLLYKQSVLKLRTGKYCKIKSVCEVLSFTHLSEKDSYICKTCDKYLNKGKLPPQNFTNNLYLDRIPEELADLSSLESRLLAQRVPFMKISARPSGGQRAISGAIVNVPIDTFDTCTHLPRPPPNSEMIMLQLKRKVEYKSSVFNQYIRPSRVLAGLDYLIKNNTLYYGINKNTSAFSADTEPESGWNDIIDKEEPDSQLNQQHLDIVPKTTIEKDDHKSLTNQTNNKTDTDTELSDDSEISSEDNEIEKCFPYDTCLQPSDGNEIFSIAPAEGNTPLSLLTDPNAEHLAFPTLFPKGRFGYTYKRDTKLHHRQYLNARLLNVDTRFATNTDYIFFSQFHAEKKQLLDNVQIALRKVRSGDTVTAADVRSSQTIQSFVSQNLAYMLLKNIRGSPAYWQKSMYDLLAMVRQLGVFTWFLTLSSADMKWIDIIRIIAQQHGVHLTDDAILNMPWEEKCKWLRNNPVTAARHFDYKVQQFFRIILLKQKVLGKVTDYFIRTEFQQRGSPHVHCVIWVQDAPVCGINTEKEVCTFVDQYISCQLPRQNDDPELFQLVSTLQQHRHTRTCRKSGQLCRFHFPKIPVPYTLLSEDKKKSCDDTDCNNDNVTTDHEHHRDTDTDTVGLDKTIPVNHGATELTVDESVNYKQILKRVGECVYSCKEKNISLPLQKILELCNTNERMYADAIRNAESSLKIFHKREPCDEFVNNYNPTILKCWEANMDLQYVTDVYACIKYIVSYVTKDERQLSDLLRNASKQANHSTIRQQLKHLGNIFLNHREISAQEAIYRVLPIPLKRTSRSVLFVPTDMENDRVKLVKPSHLIERLDDDSEDIFCNTLPERYAARPNSLETMCLADFASSYTAYIDPPDDFQSIEISSDDDRAHKHLKLKDGKGYVSKRKEPCIIRTHTFSKFKDTEKYYHSKLMLYQPWRKESELKGDHDTYEAAFNENLNIVRTNIGIFEKNSELVDDAVDSLDYNTPEAGAWELINSETIQQNMEDSLHRHTLDPDSSILAPEFHRIPVSDIGQDIGINHMDFTVQQNILPDEKYRSLIRSLNTEQRHLFDYKLDWCRSYTQSIKTGNKPEPFYTYLTGGAGTGKSVLIKAIYNMAVRELRAEGDSPDDCTVLLLAPTGTAAFNINGYTIHSALRLPIKQHSSSSDYLPLSQEKLQDLRCRFKNLTLVIIDEISMVGSQELYTIHRRLMEIKGVTCSSVYFGGISILAVGDLYQLPPVCGRPVFELPKSPLARLAGSLWMQLFKLYQLEQIMRQKDDKAFAMALNRIRTETHTDSDVLMLKTRILSTDDSKYSSDDLHIFTDNKSVDEYNGLKLQKLTAETVIFLAKDIPSSGSRIPDNMMLPDNPALTGGLVKKLCLAVGARIMITKNIDVKDGLTNGTQGTVIQFYPETFENNNQIIAILVQCDSTSSGAQTRQKYRQLARKYPNAVPIFRDEVRISISSRGGNYVSRLQFPLRLAWACTIHKTQGMTLEKAVVSLKGRFFQGQCYVALSRVSSLAGLFITHFDEEKIKASPKTIKAMHDMNRNALQIVFNPLIQRPSNLLSISMLNVRSLTRHFEDICTTNVFNLVDIICFTETWLKREETPIIFGKTQFRRDRSHKRSGGVLMYVCNNLQPIQMNNYCDKNIELINVKLMNFRKTLNIILVYVAVSAARTQTIQLLQELISTVPDSEPLIVLGDFNQVIPTTLSNNLMPVLDAPTTNTGSSVDQVFVSVDIKPLVHLSTPYFSNHQIISVGVNLQSLL